MFSSVKISIYTIIISPHLVPLAKGIADNIGIENFKYVYNQGIGRRAALGWNEEPESWFSQNKEICFQSQYLLSGIKDLSLFEQRSATHLSTFYMSERWFKPPFGAFRMLLPDYLNSASRFVKLLSNDDNFYYLPLGIYAAQDMARICGIINGDVNCYLKTPKLKYEPFPGGRFHLFEHGGTENEWTDYERRLGLHKMYLWGYFVEQSTIVKEKLKELRNRQREEVKDGKPINVLYIGRLLNLKKVDTIIKAVKLLKNENKIINLNIVGIGPTESKLKKLAKDCANVTFSPSIPINVVRELMHNNDLLVLSSNAYEGWGAVVSEAIAERMPVIGTHEAGSSKTLLPYNRLFEAGDYHSLAKLLTSSHILDPVPEEIVQWWSPQNASETLIKLIEKSKNRKK